jgi:signal transduction histidine kinase
MHAGEEPFARGPSGERSRPTGTSSRPTARALVQVLAWAAAYGLAGAAGQLTVAGSSGLPLFWPASGIALAWIATTTRRPRWDLVLVGGIAAGTAYLAGGNGWTTLNALVGVPLSLCVFVLVARHWAPGLRGSLGRAEIETVSQYGALLAAAVVAGLVENAVALVLLLPDPGQPVARTGEVALTHTIGMATVGVTLLVIAGWASALPGHGIRAKTVTIRARTTPSDLVEAAVALVLTALVILAGFEWVTGAPVSFVLVMAVVVVAIRYGPAATGLYVLAVIGVAWWLSDAGDGPIAVIAAADRRVLAFGLFASATVGTGLTIALSRRERDATIEQLRESERAAEVIADDLRLVLANLQEGVAVVEEGGRFIHANAAIGRLLALPDFNDRHVEPVASYHLVHLDGSPLLESEVPHVRAFAGDQDVHDVLRLDRNDVPGERILEVWSRMLPRIRAGDKPRAVTMVRDVTAEHQQRDALASFAHVVAHDQRNPLTSVGFWARELLEHHDAGPVDAQTGTMMLRHIESATDRMQTFISDLLTYALARDQAPSPVRVELAEVVESVVATITAVEGKRPAVHHQDLPAVWCDPVLVPQLFDNLIGNARKYVAAGVVPEVRIEATALDDDWARVRVIDNGIGIAPEDRVRVFESFERACGSQYAGSGLGLAICRHIVERHGGTIGVVPSPAGSGTCIELRLPMTGTAFDPASGATAG